MVGMMWFKREPKPVTEKTVENGVVGKLRRKKAVILKQTRESSERETSAESDKERRRYSDILDMKVSLERRDESDESLYESADCHSDAISASDDALPRLGKTPTLSKESLKIAITDEEVDLRAKKGHRKTMSLSNPLELVKNLGDEWFESTKKELERNSDKKKSRESLWSEEDRDSIHGSNIKLDQIRKNSKKEDKSQSNSRKSSTTEAPKTRKTSKGSSVSALSLFRRKKTPTSMKPVESVSEDVTDNMISTEEILNHTKLFLDGEIRHSSICDIKPPQETDSDDELPASKVIGEHRRRLSRQTSRSKSKVRGKSQSVKVNTLRKSHSGTLKKAKKKSMKTPSIGRSRQSSIVEQTPIVKKKYSDSNKHNSWLFSSSKGEPKREGSADEPPAPEADVDTSDTTAKDTPDKDNNWRAGPGAGARGVNRAESCRERDAPRRGGKHRNASDPNRLTAHNNHDLEPGAVTAPSGSSSSSSLSSRSNESNTVAADQQASQSEWSDEEEPLAAQWADSLPPALLAALQLSAAHRKRQEVIHELIVSEGSHVRWLKVLCRVFLRPLEAAPSLLPPDELRALFPNLPEVRDWHQALYQRLRAARNTAPAHQLSLRAVAQALLGTLGEPSYAASLSRFCRGQRLALEALRERRRKHKELQQFLSAREQLPLCGRLQLRDLLACVWQRLTKYRLLLESILKTVSEDEDSAEDVELLQKALDSAKDMLLSVDQAIRTTENEHRLRNIQAKLEVRANGSEWEELRRLELHSKSLRLEGELTLRLEQHKRTAVIGLMFSDMLVLLLREGERFVLRPLPHQHGLLSPIIKWDKVLFRPNAAVRNTFFLMNINGVQMHELSANTAAEYTTWVNCIQEAPLARVELKQTITPSHQASRSTDDEGVNVSRNPSDASEKNPLVSDEPESDKDSTPAPIECERDSTPNDNEPDEKPELPLKDKEESVNDDEKITASVGGVGGVGRVSTQAAPRLQPAPAPAPPPPALLATTVCTYSERLRRLDEGIEAALRAKAAIVGEVLGVPAALQQQLTELAVADSLGQVDVRSELRATRQSSVESSDEDGADSPDIRQLLLAAHAQASQLTEAISRALVVNEAAAVAARDRRGRCERCPALHDTPEAPERVVGGEFLNPAIEKQVEDSMAALQRGLRGETIPPAEAEGDAETALESCASAAVLAARVAALSGGLRGCVRALLDALPALDERRHRARAHRAATTERGHAAHRADFQMTDEIYFLKPDAEQPIQDQPSNGG